MFAKAAAQFASRVTLENLDRSSPAVDAKSLIMVLAKGVDHGHRIRITADGPDADAALRALREIVEAGLGEAGRG